MVPPVGANNYTHELEHIWLEFARSRPELGDPEPLALAPCRCFSMLLLLVKTFNVFKNPYI